MLAEHQTPRNVPRTGLRQLNVKQKCQPIVRNIECSIQLLDFIGVVSIFYWVHQIIGFGNRDFSSKISVYFVPICPLKKIIIGKLWWKVRLDSSTHTHPAHISRAKHPKSMSAKASQWTRMPITLFNVRLSDEPLTNIIYSSLRRTAKNTVSAANNKTTDEKMTKQKGSRNNALFYFRQHHT